MSLPSYFLEEGFWDQWCSLYSGMWIARPDSSSKEERTLLFLNLFSSSLNWHHSVTLLWAQRWFFYLLMQSLEYIRLVNWHLIGTVIIKRISWFQVLTLSIACVESHNLRIDDLMPRTVELLLELIVSSPCFLHASHIVHPILHRDHTLVRHILSICWIEDVEARFWINKHKVRCFCVNCIASMIYNKSSLLWNSLVVV